MNFLAHIFLSGDDEDLMIGNFIADFVKGNKKNEYPQLIRKGIELHRSIDDFTDHHPVTSCSKKRLYPLQHKYAPVVVDIFYDHFLAKNFSRFSGIPLADYAGKTYETLWDRRKVMPPRVIQFLPYMIEQNWLLSYATLEGIERTLTGLGRRLAFENRLHQARVHLEADYAGYEQEFFEFFAQLITFVGPMR
jgi:acyl carrier protein phosphodiesterase